jgi:tetratricopeptide (TPR) repeat protein
MTAAAHPPDFSAAPGNGQPHVPLPPEAPGGGRLPFPSGAGQAASLAAQGTALARQGRHEQAIASFRQALALDPNAAEAHHDLGHVLAEQGWHAEAAACFRQAVRLRPLSGAAHTSLAVALSRLGQHAEALAGFREAIRVEPGYAQAHNNLGVALAQQGQPDEAIAAFRQALRVQPDYADAHYNLGVSLGQLGQRDEAVACYREAVRLRPDMADALNNLGLALSEMDQQGQAIVLLRQAVRLRPAFAEAHNNLGLALADLGRLEEAVAAFEQALRLKPLYAEAHNNLGGVLRGLGRLEEAAACYDLAVQLTPAMAAASAHWNRALTWLHQGNFARGWAEYEWRWKRSTTTRPSFPQPLWDGGPLEGRTILLHCEQGLGDAIQFVRYAPLVQARGGRVVLGCPPPLWALFQSMAGVEHVVAEGQVLPAYDVHAPLMSLPRLLGTTLTTVPAEVPYLSVPSERVEHWRKRLEEWCGRDAFTVGICWQGNPRHKWDRHRSVPLALFRPLARVPGVRLISLQRGPGAEQLGAAGSLVTAVDPCAGQKDEFTFQDTAALIRCLDLVVTVDTAAAHLAGALGAPVWLALSQIVDWRWLDGRDDSPWYPSMRLFRRKHVGDWEPVFAQLATELHHLVRSRFQAEITASSL